MTSLIIKINNAIFLVLFSAHTAPGRTAEEAEEEATRVSLKNMFGTTENQPPLPLDPKKNNFNEAVVRTLRDKMDQRAIAGTGQ